MTEIKKGKIKKLVDKKGYGFIKVEKNESTGIKDEKDIFFHRKAVKYNKFNDLNEGDVVHFVVETTEKGPQANDLVAEKWNLKLISGYYVPEETRNLLKLDKVDNYHLTLNKYIFFEDDNANLSKKLEKFNFEKNTLDSIQEKHKRAIHENCREIEEIIVKTKWRMVIGLGGVSPYETNLTLHHIYGIPYIPATALKGNLRNYIINELFDGTKNGEKEALKNPGFCDIFGYSELDYDKEGKKGKVIFFDAYPIDIPKIKLDIMTPHYAAYYSEQNIPADWYKPIPIPFLTVEDTRFKIFIGTNSKRDKIKEGKLQGDILQISKDYLIKTLSQHGIGAKTAVGYGRLKT